MASKQDPIGDLFTNNKPVAKQSTSGVLSTIVVLALVGVLGFLVASRFDWSGGDHRQDRHEEKQDDHKKTKPDDEKKQSAVVNPGSLFVVRERKFSPIAENEAWEMIRDFAAKQTDVSARDVDDNDPSEAVQKIIAFAKSKGVDPPCVVYKPKDGELRSAIKLPSKESELLEVFK